MIQQQVEDIMLDQSVLNDVLLASVALNISCANQ